MMCYVLVKVIFIAPIKIYILTVAFLCSVLSYGSRREQPVPAGGQCVYRGLSDCAGHTQHLHHGIQGISCDSLLLHTTTRHNILHFGSLVLTLPSDPAEFRSWSQPPDEKGFPGSSVLPTDPSV